MTSSETKKREQLGMSTGKARNILIKSIMFDMCVRLDENTCYHCNKTIDKVDDFSIEHKIPFLDSEDPDSLYFSLDNISYSHLKCNIGAARPVDKTKHPSQGSYRRGCRCNDCITHSKEENKKRIKRRNDKQQSDL